MKKIRVLIVDDSSLIRSILADWQTFAFNLEGEMFMILLQVA